MLILIILVLVFAIGSVFFVDAIQSLDTFSNPVTNSNVTYNSVVSVGVNFSPGSNYVNVTQTCSTSFSQIIVNGGTNPSTGDFALPTNYIGSCVYSGFDDSGNGLNPVLINVQGTDAFIQPTSGKVIAAGSLTALRLNFDPTSPPTTFSVQLICPSVTPSPLQNVSDTLLTTFNVPSNFYGTVCAFQAVGSNFNIANVNVKITQPLTFASPVAFSSINQPNTLNISMLTGGLTVPENVSLALQCTNGGTISNIIIQTLSIIPYNYPTNYFGLCTLTVSSASAYFVITRPVTFNIKYNLNFTILPSIIYISQQFEIEIDTVPTSSITGVVNLLLRCGATTVQNWRSVPVNTAVNLTLLDTLSAQSGCAFQTSVSDQNFAFVRSDNVSISNIQLQFTSPIVDDLITVPNTLPILLISDGLPNDRTNLTTQLVCGSESVDLWVITSLQRNYQYSSVDYGPCTLSVITAPTYYVLPFPVAFSIIFNLNFTTVPTIVYIGQSINIEIDTLPASNISETVNLALVCGIAIEQTWPGLFVNTAYTLNVTGDLQPETNCTFQTSADNLYFVQTNSSNVSISNYQLLFTSPIDGTSITIPNSIPVILTVVDFPDIQDNFGAQLTCGSGTNEFGVTTSVQTELIYSGNQYGPCSINVTSVPAFYDFPEPVAFYIKFSLNLTVPTTIYIGQEFQIEIDTVPASNISRSLDLRLVCGILTVQSWTNITVNSILNLTASYSLESQSDCAFQTPESDPYFIQTNSTSVSISKVQLQFYLPIENYTAIITDPFGVLLNSPDVNDLHEAFCVSLNCLETLNHMAREVTTMTTFPFTYNSDLFYGPCFLSIVYAPSYYLIPSPLNLYLKFLLNFYNPPSVIQTGQSFIIQVNSTVSLPVTLNATYIVLFCNNQSVQTWQNVPYNQQFSLDLSDSLVPASDCYLASVSDLFDVFIQAVTTVNITSPIITSTYTASERTTTTTPSTSQSLSIDTSITFTSQIPTSSGETQASTDTSSTSITLPFISSVTSITSSTFTSTIETTSTVFSTRNFTDSTSMITSTPSTTIEPTSTITSSFTIISTNTFPTISTSTISSISTSSTLTNPSGSVSTTYTSSTITPLTSISTSISVTSIQSTSNTLTSSAFIISTSSNTESVSSLLTSISISTSTTLTSSFATSSASLITTSMNNVTTITTQNLSTSSSFSSSTVPILSTSTGSMSLLSTGATESSTRSTILSSSILSSSISSSTIFSSSIGSSTIFSSSIGSSTIGSSTIGSSTIFSSSIGSSIISSSSMGSSTLRSSTSLSISQTSISFTSSAASKTIISTHTVPSFTSVTSEIPTSTFSTNSSSITSIIASSSKSESTSPETTSTLTTSTLIISTDTAPSFTSSKSGMPTSTSANITSISISVTSTLESTSHKTTLASSTSETSKSNSVTSAITSSFESDSTSRKTTSNASTSKITTNTAPSFTNLTSDMPTSTFKSTSASISSISISATSISTQNTLTSTSDISISTIFTTTQTSTSFTSSCFIGCITSYGTSNGPASLPPINTDYNGNDPAITSYPTTQL